MNIPVARFLSHLSQFLAHLLHPIPDGLPGAKVARGLGKTTRNGADDDHGGARTGAIDEEIRRCNRR